MARVITTVSTRIPVAGEEAILQGDLALPGDASGLIVFAHGSGSSRHSPRNRMVAQSLHQLGLGTLLLDLLTEREERLDESSGRFRFDIALLGRRLVAVVDWLTGQPETGQLPMGFFGASTGAGAALIAAAQRPLLIEAVVSRGGRPDLADHALPEVQAPTLLIVGGRDEVVIELNRRALARMRCETRLEIVPHATHLFEEPGALEQAARLAGEWFAEHLGGLRGE